MALKKSRPKTTEPRKRAAQLRAATERLGLAQRAAEVGVFEWNRATNEVEMTAELEALLGVGSGPVERCLMQWTARAEAEDTEALEAAIRDWLFPTERISRASCACAREAVPAGWSCVRRYSAARRVVPSAS